MKTSIVVSYGSQTFSGPASFLDAVDYAHLVYYASESLIGSVYNDLAAFEEALERTYRILEAAQVPVHYHIRTAFRGTNHKIYRDWKLSKLANYLLSINGHPDNGNVALQQLKAFSILNQKRKT
ncbi:hypothetical protein BFP97_05520 [Roseivirga sp. 4D4]|uniref:hypothetical protein n=1 Tax=Roseivirga sp. 4D4 TaxID=1889784 RepID=UPI0008532120|nr:hypothetical protein [Roseivirga sp. 4D4]OEK01002.1 hypothetical protein BFP97_05520 [Roseivirga sp. 4D4]